MEMFFLGCLVGALFMFAWGCVFDVMGPSISPRTVQDIEEMQRQANARAYAEKTIADHNYMLAALKDD